MRVLVTRPEPGCSETAERLISLGHDPVRLPLLEFALFGPSLPDPARFSAIAFTSTNAIKAIEQRGEIEALTRLPAFTVGTKTAAAARSAGFANVTDAEGTVGSLADTILAARINGELLYPAARHRAGDLELLLERGGQRAETIEVYEMKPARISETVSQDAHVAFFYSRRTAEVFASLPNRPEIRACLCLSENVARPLRDAGLGPIHIAGAPNEDAMMDALLSFGSDDRKSD